MLMKCQALIDFAANDSSGASNSRFNFLECMVIMLDAVIWGLTFFGLWIYLSLSLALK